MEGFPQIYVILFIHIGEISLVIVATLGEVCSSPFAVIFIYGMNSV